MFSVLVVFMEESCGCSGKRNQTNGFMTSDQNKIKEYTWNDWGKGESPCLANTLL